MDDTVYNYAIIGAGAAGLQLALAMMEDSFFKDKKILILEKDQKNSNDRTWCFWEKGASKWDNLVSKSWNVGSFKTKNKDLLLELNPYQYKLLRALDFYNFAKTKIEAAPNIHWIQDEVKGLETKDLVTITTEGKTFKAKHVFDSRIDSNFFKKNDKKIRLLQPFKGWFIETEQDAFDPDRFVMMDYRIKWKDTTSFIYVLPFDKRRCLIEFTFFTPELPPSEVYDPILKDYINQVLKINNYKISHVEEGVIPMTNYPFHQHHTTQITKIGTAGGWVKPSSGYAFKNTEKFAQMVVNNIKANKLPSSGIARKWHRNYDSLIIDILYHNNKMGESLFESMYSKIKIQQIFKFLDEETSFMEDLKIMATFNPVPFLRALLKQLIQ